MSELPTDVLAALRRARDGALRQIVAEDRGQVTAAPRLDRFDITATDGGSAAYCAVDRGDGRLVGWTVEVFAYGIAGRRRYTVKAEIDLDDEDGEDWCVLNEQVTVSDPRAVPAAVDAAAATVAAYPRAALLTPGHDPEGWGDRGA